MQIEFDLSNPSYTLLHRAGLAGLWITLKQLEKDKVNAPLKIQWKIRNRQVTLKWENNDDDQTVIEWLLKESFQLQDGLIALRGLDAKTIRKDALVIVHQGILGTFLQHNSTHKSTGVIKETLQLEEGGVQIPITYKSLSSYAYQDFASNLCDTKRKFFGKPISIAGWLNPGAVVRHVAFSTDTSFEESAENAFLLLFAPVACYYYVLRSRLRDKRAQYALVIPEITDLEKYASYRQNEHLRNAVYKDFYASGLGDAGLRFLTYETTANIANTFGLSSCQVVTLGTVAWSTQQKTRTDLYIVQADSQICKNYHLCKDYLPDKSVKGKENGFIACSFAREIIAENLARNQSWYAGLANKVNSNELFDRLTYERGGLNQMVQKADWAEREKLFVQVCHEAIKNTYGKISGRAKKQSEIANLDRETIRIRTGLARCKNSETFREFITDFWSRAGKIPTLQENWQELMELVMQEKHWKKSRDLALLALASYKGKGVNNEEENEYESDITETQTVNESDDGIYGFDDLE